MRAIAFNLIVKLVINANPIPAMLIHRVRQHEKALPVPCTILPARMPPRRRHEKVSMNRLVQQRIDHVAPRAEFQQCLGEFQPDAREFVVVCGISYEFADPGAEGEAFGPGHFDAGEEEGAEVEI